MSSKKEKIKTLKSWIANRSPEERIRLNQLHESLKKEMQRLRKEEYQY